MALSSETPERAPIEAWTKAAVILSMVGFVIPFLPAVVAFVLAAVAKARLRRRGGDRMNEGLNTIAQATAVFTLVLYGGFVWYQQHQGWL